MVNHGLAEKLAATDVLLFNQVVFVQKIHFFIVSRSFCNNVILTLICLKEILLTCRFLTDIMHFQLNNSKHNSATSNTLWACVIFLGQITVQRYFVFVSTVGLLTLYIQELPYMNTFCESILKKIGPTHAHFQYNARKLMSLKSVLP